MSVANRQTGPRAGFAPYGDGRKAHLAVRRHGSDRLRASVFACAEPRRLPHLGRRARTSLLLAAALSPAGAAFAVSPAQERKLGGSPEAAAIIANSVPITNQIVSRLDASTTPERAPSCKVAEPGEPFHATYNYGDGPGERSVYGLTKTNKPIRERRVVYVSGANKAGPVVVHWTVPFAHLQGTVTLNLRTCVNGDAAAVFGYDVPRPEGNTNKAQRAARTQFYWITRGVGKKRREVSHSVKALVTIPRALATGQGLDPSPTS